MESKHEAVRDYLKALLFVILSQGAAFMAFGPWAVRIALFAGRSHTQSVLIVAAITLLATVGFVAAERRKLNGFWRGVAGGLVAALVLALARLGFASGEVAWIDPLIFTAITALRAAGYPLQILLRHMRPVFAIAVVSVVSQASYAATLLLADSETSLLMLLPGVIVSAMVAAAASTILQPAPNRRISTSFFMSAWSIGAGLPLLLIVNGMTGTMQVTMDTVALTCLFGALLLAITLSVLVYKMWNAIPGGHSRTTPGRAVGFMFLPIYNLYWIFQVFPGWATDYDIHVNSHKLDAPPVSGDLFTAYCVLVLATPIPVVGLFAIPINFFVGMAMIARICDAINALPAHEPRIVPGASGAITGLHLA